MVLATTEAGVSYYEATDPAEIHTATSILANSIDTKLVPRFSTTTARGTAIATPVQGQLCSVDGIGLYRYNGSAWQLLVPGSESTARLLFQPGGTLSSVTSGSGTWITLGSITVPAWATLATIDWSLYGIFAPSNGIVANAQLKIGSGAGMSCRLNDPNVVNQRFSVPIHGDSINVSSLSGSQSVTILVTWSSGTAASYTADGNSRCGATVTFTP